jgi:hypothetical protein
MKFISLEVNENLGGSMKGHEKVEVDKFTFGSFSLADPW